MCLDEFTFDDLILARKNALIQIINQTALSFSEKVSPAKNFIRVMGSDSYNRTYTETVGTKSVFYHTTNAEGGIIKLSAIGLMVRLPQDVLSKTITFQIKKDGTVLKSYELEVEMCENYGSYRTPDEKVYNLPEPYFMVCDGSTYEVCYNYDGSYQICDNEFTCGCSAGRSTFSTHLRDTSKQKGYGMRLQSHFNCDNAYILCSVITQNPALVGAVGQMIIYKTLALFVKKEESKRLGNLSSLSLSGHVDLAAMYEAYEGLYLAALDTILQNKSIYQFNLPCFTCRRNSVAVREGIIF